MRWNYNRFVFWMFVLVFVLFQLYSINTDSHYKWDFFFIIGIWAAVYYLKDKIKLHPLHFFLLGIFLVSHNMGTFGFYSNIYFGFEYDFWVHSYFGFVSALMLYRTYNLIGPYKGWFVYIAIIAVVLGFSAFHELFEYGGAMAVGKGEGVLFVGAGDLDEWDTQKDMRNNLLGAVVGLVLYGLYNSFSYKKKVSKSKKSRRKRRN